MTDLDETITPTNPENFPDNDVFRQGIVEAADFYHLLMENMTGQERLDLAETLIGAVEVAMSQTDSPEPQILYTFHVVKGADVLHASMTTGNPAAYTMVGIPIPDPELAVLLRNIGGDGANLQ